ncbi:MAG: hypothetical protein SGI92_07150 [Bryobacteraceae bacterium]|nr:hypothetical protein [Bryobacteraceae bacterium]
MLRSVWMHPWDLEARDPDAVLAWLEAHGRNACHLAVCYHGGRMVLPMHPSRRVMDHGSGGCYLPLDPTLFPRPELAPAVEPQWPQWIEPFLAAASRRKFPVHAWVVLNHRDFCPPAIHDLCLHNVHGDIYTYALCPSNLEVRMAFAELCRQIEAFGGFAGLQLEGLGYLGYNHQSLHDKTGIDLPPDEVRRLSQCTCAGCRVGVDRTRIQQEQLRLIRAATTLPLCLRTAADPKFIGGKSTLTAAQSAGLVQSLCLTWFGAAVDLTGFSRDGFDGPVYGGFIFHGPDCRTREDYQRRAAIVDGLDGQILYCAGMAAPEHWAWVV